MSQPGDQIREKASALFGFLNELSRIRSRTVVNVTKQEWCQFLDEIPVLPEYVSFPYRDSNADSNVVLRIKNPKLESCPEPPRSLRPYLEKGWDDYRKEPALVENDSALANNETLRREYERWIAKRKAWAPRRRLAQAIQELFDGLFGKRKEFERDAESQELVIGNGIFRAKDAQMRAKGSSKGKQRSTEEIEHPIITRRLRIDFNAREDVIELVMTDDETEIYDSLFSSIEDIEQSEIPRFETRLHNEDLQPLGADGLENWLQEFVHSLSPHAEFSPTASRDFIAPNTEFRVYLRPVIFIRNRIDGAPRVLQRILDSINSGAEIPRHIRMLVGNEGVLPQEEDENVPIERLLAETGGEDPEILLAEKANREQLAVARQLQTQGAVLVQGPPGTGKTHTIANLTGHFLAQGKTVLITSYSSKALTVVKEKLNEGIRDLCVAVLDDSRKDMESSISKINDYVAGGYSSTSLKKTIQRIELNRENIIKILGDLRSEAFRIRFKDHKSIVYEGEAFSPVEAAQFVGGKAKELKDVIPGSLVGTKVFPLTDEELSRLYSSNGDIGKEDEHLLSQNPPDPSSIMPPEELRVLIERSDELRLTMRAIEERHPGWRFSEIGEKTGFFIGDAKIKNLGIETIRHLDSLTNSLVALQSPESWAVKAMADWWGDGLGHTQWTMLIESIEAFDAASRNVQSLGVELPLEEGIEAIRETVTEAIDVWRRKGKLRRLSFSFNKKLDRGLFDRLKVNGRTPSSIAELETVLNELTYVEAVSRLRERWDGTMAAAGAPRFDELAGRRPEEVAKSTLPELGRIDERVKIIKEIAGTFSPEGSEFDVLAGIGTFDAGDLAMEKRLAFINNDMSDLVRYVLNQHELEDLTARMQAEMDCYRPGKHGRSSICVDLHKALEDRDLTSYELAYDKLTQLYGIKKVLEYRNTLLEKIKEVAPDWAQAIRAREGIHGLLTPPSSLHEAWKWRFLKQELDVLDDADLNELQEKIEEYSGQYRKVTEALVRNKAWHWLLKRTEQNNEMQRALTGWAQTNKLIGKGTGRNAPKRRRQARIQMRACREAVPVWIMPLQKVYETLDPDMRFDVVIIDEASQADITALVVAYMAEQLIVVGDDKQVSPLAVGVLEEEIDNLRDRFFSTVDITNSHLFGPDYSLYDMAATTYTPLMLKEHFRCVPDIIGFSNGLSYDWKIQPLRDQSSSSLLPAVVDYRVAGVRNNKQINEEEARAIVSLVKGCIAQPEYEGKTFGVISLLGDAQFKYIERLFEKHIGRRELENRRFLCGNPSHFQGDERDVIWLSMVDSNENESALRRRSIEDSRDVNKKRYNVAVSRAKDQVWVVHSLSRTDDLKTDDIRRELLDFAHDPQGYIGNGSVLRKSDSPFEEAVARELNRVGYRIEQQYSAGSYRIDIVVSSEDGKVAIECDGEAFHSSDDAIRHDMERQEILERVGWRFIRIRGSEYYKDPESAMARLRNELSKLGIEPQRAGQRGAQSSQLLERVKQSADKAYYQFFKKRPKVLAVKNVSDSAGSASQMEAISSNDEDMVAALSESPFEQEVAEELLRDGYRIEQQVEFDFYRIDIVVTSLSKKVAIECDGEAWHSGDEALANDQKRQAYLEGCGWNVVRIRGRDFYQNREQAMSKLRSELRAYGIFPYAKASARNAPKTKPQEERFENGKSTTRSTGRSTSKSSGKRAVRKSKDDAKPQGESQKVGNTSARSASRSRAKTSDSHSKRKENGDRQDRDYASKGNSFAQKVNSKRPSGMAEAFQPGKKFFLREHGSVATGFFITPGDLTFTVRSGSVLAFPMNPKTASWVTTMRDQLTASGDLEGNVLMKNLEFKDPGEAAEFVTTYPMTTRVSWQDDCGHYLMSLGL